MRPISESLKKKIAETGNHGFFPVVKIAFKGETVELTREDFSLSKPGTLTDGLSAFSIGNVLGRSVTVNLTNYDGRWSNRSFTGAKIILSAGYEDEEIPLGTYSVLEAVTPGTILNITGLDNCYLLDKAYIAGRLSFPTTAKNLLSHCCSEVFVDLKSTSFFNDSQIIENEPEGLTYREIIGYIAQMAAGNARFDEKNQLEIISFSQNGPVTLDALFSLNLASENITITGLQLLEDEVIGESGYILALENPLITDEQSKEYLETIGQKLIGLTFRPFEAQSVSDPLAECMDTAVVIDGKGNQYQSFIGASDFSFYGKTTLSCKADSPLTVNRAKKNTEQRLNREIAQRKADVANLQKQIDSGGGGGLSGDYALKRDTILDSTLSIGGKAVGSRSLAGGDASVANGMNSISYGSGTHANGANSQAFGWGTLSADYQMAIGAFNQEEPSPTLSLSGWDGTFFAVGAGIGDTEALRKTVVAIDSTGNIYTRGRLITVGSDNAELFEWQDGNPEDEKRTGLFVTLDGDKIRLAESGDEILGIVSAIAGTVQNERIEWNGKYLKNPFGEPVLEYQTINGKTYLLPKLNPEYDPSLPYQKRSDRKEWAVIGLSGRLPLLDDGSCQVNGYAQPLDHGMATSGTTGYRVLKRISENVIEVLMK